jgi:peptidyl-tRNA hydrolase
LFFVGKVAAQVSKMIQRYWIINELSQKCSHATLGCFQKACEKIPSAVDTWFSGGQAKVICKCESDDDL